ncbi:glycerophosphodiester phosphodiesterase [Algoriphagus aquimarinus]|uniref:Glycerophosphoryl diester phosphodiesterase n=1 Tax=Algoriphagus aquimarinus TaxID=237018 RepID=A0A1I1B223_9BACT|nr:glycerophosphodiester phosphodiesterase family protein [Algoriphagus aquimarinus]SFB43842.1 glycerophosphoryl diester phosphodiesterase [Algoriphagus aquimarinus]
MNSYFQLTLFFCLLTGNVLSQNTNPILPTSGLCAHRGAMETHPENTIPAFQAAISAGAQMIEFDVWLSQDKEMVVMHDETVDRTTDGRGEISGMNLAEIKKLDAGSWKSTDFEGVRVPTLEEVLEIMPYNIWLNIHIKGEGELPAMVAELVKKQNRLHQAFLASSLKGARKAQKSVPEMMICNMDRQNSTAAYVSGTLRAGTEFIQLRDGGDSYTSEQLLSLKNAGVKTNYFKANSLAEIKKMLADGIDFPLVNDIVLFMKSAEELGIKPVVPQFDLNLKE